MSRKNASVNDILDAVIAAPNRQASTKNIAIDPVVDTDMVVDIADISQYEHNPRRALNEKYAEIKHSIKSRGYSGVMEITRRPGDEKYIVCAGANTTLAVIKELFAETKEKRFQRIRCLFKPYANESTILINHLIENETHGQMIFIDKAVGIVNAKANMEHELGKELSQREFCDALAGRGFKLDQAILSRYEYAVKVLLPLLPNAMAAGLGRPQIERLRKIETSMQKYLDYVAAAAETYPQWTQLFYELVSDSDSSSDAWSADSVQNKLERELAVAFDKPLQNVKLNLNTLITKGAINLVEVPKYEFDSDPEKTSPEESSSEKTSPEESSTENDKKSQRQEDNQAETAIDSASNKPKAKVNPVAQNSIEPGLDYKKANETESLGHADSEDEGPASFTDSDGINNPDLDSFFAAGNLAKAREQFRQGFIYLADKFALSDLCAEVVNGPGVLLEVPQTKIINEKHTLAWYFLVQYTEQLSITAQTVDYLPNSNFKLLISNYLAALNSNDEELLHNEDKKPLVNIGSEPFLGELNHLVMHQMSKDDLNQYAALQQAYIELRKLCQEEKLISIWQLDENGGREYE